MKTLEIMNLNEDELKLRILNHIAKDFLNHGFRNFALDKIASELHISKKTIYKDFRSKEELIRIVLIKQLTVAYREVVTIIQAQSNIIEKFIDLSNMVEEYFSVFNEASIKRLKHYFPQLADYIEQFRINRVVPLINLLLKIGKKKKMILDIPEEIILKVFNSSLGSIVESKSDPTSKFSYHQMFRQVFNMLLNAILTKKGKQLLSYKLEVIK